MVADRAKLCIESYWQVVGGLSIGTNPNSPNPRIGNLKTRPSNYGQALADGATF